MHVFRDDGSDKLSGWFLSAFDNFHKVQNTDNLQNIELLWYALCADQKCAWVVHQSTQKPSQCRCMPRPHVLLSYGRIFSTRFMGNRLEIKIEVDEGKSAKIEKINIIGNEIYTNEELLDGFELSEGSFFSFLNNDNAYSREKLQGDIESLESFYKDRGYLKFSIESTQISLSTSSVS